MITFWRCVYGTCLCCFFSSLVILNYLCYCLQIGIVHSDNVSRELVPLVDVSPNVEGVVVKAVDVSGDFNNKKVFDDRESMFSWIRRNATNLGFGVVIGRLDNGTARRNDF